jgi:hypothetical protein
VIAGVIAAKLDGKDLLDFLMPHTEAQLRKWQASNIVGYPKVDSLTGNKVVRIQAGYNALKELKAVGDRNSANQLDLPVRLVLPAYKIFLSFLRRCRQAFSDMHYMNAHLDKEDVMRLMYKTFKMANTRDKLDSTLARLKKTY